MVTVHEPCQQIASLIGSHNKLQDAQALMWTAQYASYIAMKASERQWKNPSFLQDSETLASLATTTATWPQHLRLNPYPDFWVARRHRCVFSKAQMLTAWLSQDHRILDLAKLKEQLVQLLRTACMAHLLIQKHHWYLFNPQQ